MFRALCTHHQEVKLYYTASGIVTLCRWPYGAQVESAPAPPDDEYIVLETCRGI